MLETAGPQRSADSISGPNRTKSTTKLSGTMNKFKSMLKGQQQQQQHQYQQQSPSGGSIASLQTSSDAASHRAVNQLTSTQSPSLSTSDRSSISSCELPHGEEKNARDSLATNSIASTLTGSLGPKDKLLVVPGKPAVAVKQVGSTLVPTPSSTSLNSNQQKGIVTPRFEPLEDGSHVHHLKSAKRQEKLGNMLRDLLIGGRRSSAVDRKEAEAAAAGVASATQQQQVVDPAQPPSLMAGFLNQMRNADGGSGAAPENLLVQVAQSSMGGTSFAQKYGKCHEIIGKGSYGVVRIAHKTDPKDQREQLFAVKEVKKRNQESQAAYSKRLTSEFCISSSLHHPNIIRTLDLLLDAKGEYCEVMELCCGGDLYSLVLTAGKLEYQEADCFFKQIVRGVNYMHEMGVAHRDLKPENILLTSQGAVKITDFGNGECFRMAWEKKVHLSEGVCGSEPYIAPEEFLESKFDPRAVDIWAIGVIYMAMRTGRHLWRIAKAEEDKFYSRYLQGRKDEDGYEPIESLKRARCRNVIYSILDPVASRRITGKQILKSEWGREIRVCDAGEKGL